MAYDKVVDSAALDGALTGIADAIRGKTGNTEKLTMEGMAAAIAGIQAGGGGLPEGMNAFFLTLTETYNTSAAGWEIIIPHGLGTVPAFAVVMRTTPVRWNSEFRGWFGDAGTNSYRTNFTGGATEQVPMQDSAAKWIFADDTNLYCRSGGWGGALEAGLTLFVGVAK